MRVNSKPSTSRYRVRAKKVGTLMESALGQGLKKRGFANADLVAHWHHIAPPPYNICCVPEKLIWPRKTPAQNDEDVVKSQAATLVLQVEPSKKLDVEYEKDGLRHAINAYFGFELVGHIRLSKYPLVRHVEPQAPPRQATVKQTQEVQNITEGVDDKGLREALTRLGQNLAAKHNE